VFNLRSFLAGAVSAVVAVIVVSQSYAQDPVQVSPDLYNVLLDNDQVRIFEVTYPPGQKEGWHGHPRYFFYVVQPGTLRSERESGETREVELELGQNRMTGPTERHSVTNVGDSVVRLLAVEFK